MQNSFNTGEVAVIILAAGLGTRMKSDRAKVLHEILGRPMILYIVETAKKIAGNNVVLVIGNQAEKVREIVSEGNDVSFALQENQLGTGHAVLCAMPEIPDHIDDILILCGDVPLITADTLMQFMVDHTEAKRDVSLLAVEVDNPKGYGRVLIDRDMNISGIAEDADSTKEQKKIRTINSGIYCAGKDYLADTLQKIRPDNMQGEFYLTDIIGIGYKEGKSVGATIGSDSEEFIGVNTPDDLKTVEAILRQRSGKIS
ncbi:NTP transferase domain-containing protein [Desulfococcaceae bacterium HSG8]|nr:NTP transferase domain-containing protein [Desulfococcaceae bacterium HSG8]